jgi:hypothetical protein
MTHATYLFTDADNTLWDTDTVYAEAQLALLRDLELLTGHSAPDAEDQGLASSATLTSVSPKAILIIYGILLTC